MLMLHVDSENVQRDELANLFTPPATATWQPVGHRVFDALVRESLAKAGIKIQRSHYGLSRRSDDGYRPPAVRHPGDPGQTSGWPGGANHRPAELNRPEHVRGPGLGLSPNINFTKS